MPAAAAAARRTLLRHGRLFPAGGAARARRRQRVELREGIGLIDGDGSEQQRVDSSPCEHCVAKHRISN